MTFSNNPGHQWPVQGILDVLQLVGQRIILTYQLVFVENVFTTLVRFTYHALRAGMQPTN